MDHPTWTEVLEDVLEHRVGQIHTAMPGKVVSYSQSTQVADIEPQLRVDGQELPVIPSVPVVWPCAYSDISAGDTVLLIFCEGDIGLWRAQGEAGEPNDVGRHGLHGAVALAGLRTSGSPLTHVAGSTVLPGLDVRLSDPTAANKVLRGSALALDWLNITPPGFLVALKAWAAAVSGAAGLGGPTLAALNAAIDNAMAGLSVPGTYLSDEVKVP